MIYFEILILKYLNIYGQESFYFFEIVKIVNQKSFYSLERENAMKII